MVEALAGGTELRLNENRFGSPEMEITDVRVLDADGRPIQKITSGAPLQVQIGYRARDPIPHPIFGITVSREDGFICYDTSTVAAGLTIPALTGEGQVSWHLDREDLLGGNYYIDVGVYEQEWAYAYDYHWHVYPICVWATPHERGVLRPPHQWWFDASAFP